MRPAALLPLLALVGCKGLPDVCDDYSSRTCIALEINLASGGPTAIDAVVITPIQGLTLSQGAPDLTLPKGTAAPLPILVPILPATLSGAPIVVDVHGMLSGQVVGDATFTGQLRNGDHQQITVALGRPNDMGVAQDQGGGGGGGVGGGGGSGGGACDLVAQTNCPSSSKCDIASQSATTTMCVADGTVATGGLCTLYPNDNCARGNACYAPTSGISWCVHFCNVTSDCPAGTPPVNASNGAHCCSSTSECSNLATYYKAGPAYGCSIPCNPVSALGASGCPSGSKCEVETLNAGTELTTCYILGTGTDGVSCTKTADCAAGYGCFSTHCRQYCRKNTNSDCTITGETCFNVTTGGGGGSGGSWSFIGACCPAAGC